MTTTATQYLCVVKCCWVYYACVCVAAVKVESSTYIECVYMLVSLFKCEKDEGNDNYSNF